MMVRVLMRVVCVRVLYVCRIVVRCGMAVCGGTVTGCGWAGGGGGGGIGGEMYNDGSGW